MDPSPPPPARILYVCTGNICRSPYAALHTRFLLEARIGPQAGRFAVSSAGVGAVVGSGMHPSSREQLANRRDHPATERFRARQLGDDEVAAADLVLTMTRRQRSRVLHEVPSALRRTFTLRELARLLDAVEVDALPDGPTSRLRAVAAAAFAARGSYGPVPADDDDVPDPVAGDADAHAASARVVDAAVRRVLAVIAPARVHAPSPSLGPLGATARARPPDPLGATAPARPPARPRPPSPATVRPVAAGPAAARAAARPPAAPPPGPTPDAPTVATAPPPGPPPDAPTVATGSVPAPRPSSEPRPLPRPFVALTARSRPA